MFGGNYNKEKQKHIVFSLSACGKNDSRVVLLIFISSFQNTSAAGMPPIFTTKLSFSTGCLASYARYRSVLYLENFMLFAQLQDGNVMTRIPNFRIDVNL